MSFLEKWDCVLPETEHSYISEVLESKIKADKKSIMFLKKISFIESKMVSEFKDCNKMKARKLTFLMSKPTLKQLSIKPAMSNINIIPTVNKYVVSAKSSTIAKENIKIKEATAQFLASAAKKDLLIIHIPNSQTMINSQSYQLLQKVRYDMQSKRLDFEEWFFTISAKDIFADDLVDNNLKNCSDYNNKIQCLQDKSIIHTYLLQHNGRKINGEVYSFKQTFESSFWKLPEINKIDPDYFNITEKFDSRIFFCKKLPLTTYQKPKTKIKFNMWVITNQILKKMCWKVFTLDPRANLLTKENFQKIDYNHFFKNDCTLFEEIIFTYIFPKIMDFRISLKTRNPGYHKQETFLYECKNKDEVKKSYSSELNLKRDEFDLLVLNKSASRLKSPCTETNTSNNDNTNVAVNESTFYFDSNSVTNSTFKSNSICKTENFIPKVFCNFNKLNKKILQKLHHSDQITVFEGENKDFAHLKCQVILNQKSCVFFTKCMDFIQINPKTKQLYIYQEVMQLCEIFENIYIVFTDCEDQTLERLQKCKLALLENFQQFSRIHIFELDSDYYENGFTEEILIPLILQNSLDSKNINFNYLIEDNETVYELLAIGFDLYTSNILNTISNLINKIINNSLSYDDKTIVTKRIHDIILRYLND